MTKHPNNQLSIVFYSPAMPESGASNGIVTYTRIMRDALRLHGHQVFVVTTDEIEQADGTVVPLERAAFFSRKLRLWAEAWRQPDGSNPWVRYHVLRALSAALKLRPDVIEMEESHGWAGRVAKGRVAVVERLHGPHGFVRDEIETPEERRIGDFREEAERASLTKVQGVSAPSNRLLRELINRHGIKLQLARTIPNPMPVAPADAAWDVSGADPSQIVFVGRFDLCKGADVIVRAFAIACEQRPSLSLVMLGPDTGLKQPSGRTMHFDEFVRKELSPDVRSRIRFLGTQSQQQVMEWRRGSGLTIIGSRFESFSYSIAEAMSIGMPVLTSDNIGGGELIRDGLDGRVVPIGDVAATADAILEMTASPTRLREMGRSAYARAADLLSPERIACDAVDLYRDAISRLSVAQRSSLRRSS